MYLNQSISEQRDVMPIITADNADAVGLTAILLSTMATCLLEDDADSAEVTYTPPVQWLTMHASIAVVFSNAVPLLRPDGPMVRYALLTSQSSYTDSSILFDPNNLTLFEKLLDFQHPADNQELEEDPSVQDACVKAVAFLGSIAKALQQKEERQRICMRVVTFGHTIPMTFIRLLAERMPRALAILANYMAFVKYIEKILVVPESSPKRDYWESGRYFLSIGSGRWCGH